MGGVGQFAPDDAPGREAFAIERSPQQMSFQCEVMPDRTEARQEGLRALQVAKASHAALALPRGLMAVLCSVVDTGRSLDHQMLHVDPLRDVGFRRRIATQLIGDDLAWHRVGAQRTLEETSGGDLVTSLLQQDAEFDAVLVDCAPRQVRFATQSDEHLIEVPRATRLAGPIPHFVRRGIS
ncbi:hypothetical protein WJ63_04255 [Burkholderia pyrrocinia]|nr:hypothetical protein WJ63_04255 [Burkholderia pyrrocinia]